ncbi:MAG TPA: hypothetical protein DEQ14_09915 [Treponema sp.]|nr:hypothetical protein [Treponema sp.]
MKRTLFLALAVFLVSAVWAQEETTIGALGQLDSKVSELGVLVSARLGQLPAGSKIRVENFLSGGGSSILGAYWKNQTQSALLENSGSAFVVLDSAAGMRGNFSISGEIYRLGGVTRIYTRLIDTTTSTVLQVWQSDLRLSGELAGLVAVSQFTNSGGAVQDMNEPDSMDAPVMCDAGSVLNRALHQGDTDWFIVTAPESANLRAETSGELDTKMVLYDADSREELDDDDDSGEDTNASIAWLAEAGKRYIIKISGYDRGEVGDYGFSVFPANSY